MSIKIKSGDLLQDKTEAIINTVNCVGVMGKGIAFQFKQKWPDNFLAYKKICNGNNLRPGKMFIYELGKLLGKPHYIVNFPTKNHWKEKSKISYIEDGLKELVGEIKKLNIKSISVPPLGCGNGGLEWQDVYKLIIKYLEPISNEVDIYIYMNLKGRQRLRILLLTLLAQK